MADHVGELDNGDTGFELFDDEGVAQVVDFGARDTGNTEVAVDGGANIADQEGVAGLGNKKSGVLGFGAFFDIFFDGCFGGIVEWDASGVMRLKGADF